MKLSRNGCPSTRSVRVGVSALDNPWHRITLDPQVRWADLSGALELEARNDRGQTPLMLACRTHNAALIGDLLAAGAQVGATNATGTTPLMYAKTVALASGSLDILDALVAAGARADTKDAHGLTARDYVETRSRLICDYLEKHGG